jgi:anti-sigma factor RsiW
MSQQRCHLDDLAAALADNELDHDQRDRALAHITGCDPCRAEVDAQRRLKALLANQADPEVSSDLTARLCAIAVVAAGPNHPDVVRTRRRTLVAPPARPRSFRSKAATYSALSVALVAGVVAVGGESGGTKVRPPVTAYLEEHTATTDQMGPLYDPASNVVLASLK